MKTTIGKNTLGDNNKMQISLKNYNRSTHDLSFKILNTQSPGTLVPLYKRVVLPGDTINLDTDVKILTHPTVGPLFGSFKFQMDYFFCPIRLYNSWLHNNRLGIGLDMSQIKLPMMELRGSQAEFSHSSLISYLGIKGLGTPMTSGANIIREMNAVPYLAYWDIFKNYYANTQQTHGYTIANTSMVTNFQRGQDYITIDGINSTLNPPITLLSKDVLFYQPGTILPENMILKTNDGKNLSFSQLCDNVVISGGGYAGVVKSTYANTTLVSISSNKNINVAGFPLTVIDDMRDTILSTPGNTTFKITQNSPVPYNYSCTTINLISSNILKLRNLAIKTYNSDLFNNWVRTSWITGENGINAITAIDTSSGSFTMDTLNLSKKVYDMLNRIAVSGGTYNDWIETVYTNEYFQRSEIPIFIGGMSTEIMFQEVINTSASEGEALGTLAGKGRNGDKKGGHIKFKADEPGYILGISSITPRIVYSQGNDWDMYSLKTLNDLHKPALDAIGFQDLITEQMHYRSSRIDGVTGEAQYRSAGKQPAWLNYMTDVDKAAGNFAEYNDEMFMTLNRRYSVNETMGTSEGAISDLTTYIQPDKFNYAFAQTDVTAQNFWVHMGIKDIERRVISAKQIPIV